MCEAWKGESSKKSHCCAVDFMVQSSFCHLSQRRIPQSNILKFSDSGGRTCVFFTSLHLTEDEKITTTTPSIFREMSLGNAAGRIVESKSMYF